MSEKPRLFCSSVLLYTVVNSNSGYYKRSPVQGGTSFSRSRTKNMMWYGVLGTKELLHRTYRNLEQKVLLEVSGSLLAW